MDSILPLDQSINRFPKRLIIPVDSSPPPHRFLLSRTGAITTRPSDRTTEQVENFLIHLYHRTFDRHLRSSKLPQDVEELSINRKRTLKNSVQQSMRMSV